jgi:Divergent InlB B-repeat domain
VSGQVLDTPALDFAAGSGNSATPFRITGLPSTDHDPAVAFDGTNYLVAWTQFEPGSNARYTIYSARVSQTGTVLGSPFAVPPLNFLAPATTHYRPAVASDGSAWLVVSSGSANGVEDVYGARVGADGGVLDRPAVKISRSETANARAPSLVFDGTQYVAAWVNVPFLVGAPPLGVYGARISTAGEVRDPGGVRLSSADMNGAVALAADGLGTTLVAYDVFDPVVDAESIEGVLVSAWSDTQGPLGPYPLSWSTTGSGRGTIVGTLPDGSAAAVTCTANGSCSGIFARGTVIRLTPSASGGSVFTGWSGACAGTGACTVTMTSARAVVATFASTVPQPRASRSLVVATTAGGGGRVRRWRDRVWHNLHCDAPGGHARRPHGGAGIRLPVRGLVGGVWRDGHLSRRRYLRPARGRAVRADDVAGDRRRRR